MKVLNYLNFLSSPRNIFLVSGYEEDDRLSSLPDDIIHKVLSFVGTKDAIRASVLSSRWRYIWTSMPYLSFSFMRSKFVMDVLSHRNNLSGVSSFHLEFGTLDSASVERIMNYALSHNVQQLTLKLLQKDNITLPVSLFSSRSLKHLTLDGFSVQFNTPKSTWELLALTTLHLNLVNFCNDNSINTCIDLFSKCINLKNLTLNQCTFMGSKGFLIDHPRLSNLIIINISGKIIQGKSPLYISTLSLHSLEKFHLCIDTLYKVDASKIFGLLQHLHGVKFLTLNKELVEFLSSSLEKLIYTPPCPFSNLKSLKIYPAVRKTMVTTHADPPPKLSNEIKNCVVDGSPSASFTLISHKEELAEWMCFIRGALIFLILIISIVLLVMN